MTEPIQLYPQTKIRINATYHAGKVGDFVPAGQPETVEIEINETVPAEDLLDFITGLVAALFRAAPDGVQADVTVDPDPGAGDQVDTAQVSS